LLVDQLSKANQLSDHRVASFRDKRESQGFGHNPIDHHLSPE
jgi:hypothetical protein